MPDTTPDSTGAAGRAAVKPRLSVVVVMLGGPDYVPRCLSALASQKGAPDTEIMVPCDDRVDDVTRLRWREEFPGVQIARVPGHHTYAGLRAHGARRASGDIVAFTEDHCIAPAHWCAEIVAAHAEPYAAVGGPVDKLPSDTTVNWAVYLSDFSRYAQPVAEGPSAYLTDVNVSYKRTALDTIAHLWKEEFHETIVNWALLAKGETLWLTPHLVVHQQRSLELGAALHERFEFGRLFASTRAASTTGKKRTFYAALSPLLPGVLSGRVVSNVIRKRRYRRELVVALPLICTMAIVWSLGEFIGYVTGRPGK